MGMGMSFIGGSGGFASKSLSVIMGALFDQFVEKDIKDFNDFHTAILDIFNTINMALPGKHYDAPHQKEVKDLYEKWSRATKEEDKKKIFTEFMNKNVNLSKVDQSMVITGAVAPPAAMVVKRSGQTLPHLTVMKAIPDVVFVPTATILALIVVKVSKRMLFKNVASSS
ncbi:hypothetical protein Lal_00011339 [Lupinus albus]|uniref:Uncharacterized protein n=1 Tax=Lupinus albus TaxID=3870 RepID=A0A6A5NX13_LUPAL|nr:hypothetical protein Lalb_Chr13g0290561 [Lupinus albus]KAF1888565.1 hypothetical protein Lal_00011339 [Lupinus albus]